MTTTDIIRPYGHSLYLRFGSTGESRGASTLQLDAGITVSLEGQSMLGRYHRGESSFIIERFATDHLASNALAAVEAAMHRFARRQRVSHAAKGVVLWGIAPFVAAMFALGLNAAASHSRQPADAVIAGANSGYASGAPQAAQPQRPTQPAEAAKPPAAEVAKGMSNAVNAGKFSIKLSSGTKGTLYVFSDPLCPHCRDFERQLDTLSKSYTVHLFPVSVVGGANSSTRVAQLLCAEPAARPEAWRKLITGGPISGGAECADGGPASEANNRIFHALGLPGTPTVVAGDGRIMPDTMSLKAESVSAWMQGSSGG